MLSPNDSGILLPDRDADPERELQGKRSGRYKSTRSTAIPCQAEQGLADR